MFKFYDEGWNAYIDGLPFNENASRDWKDGYKDCAECPKDKHHKI